MPSKGKELPSFLSMYWTVIRRIAELSSLKIVYLIDAPSLQCRIM